VFARPEHPLVLFLDDLQWVDRATLELLQHLVVTREVQHLLLIGAYRDNEIDSFHPLTQMLAAVKTEGIEIRNVALAALAFDDLAQLVCDSLRIDSKRAHSLIELLHEKTRGNPFFAIQFLRGLADEGLIVFNSREQSWRWDSDRIHAKNFTDNVVTFMEGRLGRLPAGAQETLKIFACLGHSARTGTLAMAQAVSEEETETSLSVAVREGLIVRNGDHYTFLHDRVQEAAYERVPPAERAGEHLRIGRRLVKQLSEENVFEVVNQFNRGVALITNSGERKHLAEMNLAAGRRSNRRRPMPRRKAIFPRPPRCLMKQAGSIPIRWPSVSNCIARSASF
jgi:predicted ATPase